MPNPDFRNNWKQETYKQNIMNGVLSLQQGKNIQIMDDSRGYELALEIKNRFILEYQKLLSEKITIEKNSNGIIIQLKNKNNELI